MKNIKSVILRHLKRADNECSIYIRYTYNRKFILFNTNVAVKPYLFNSLTGRVKKSVNYENKNIILRQKEAEVERKILELIAKQIEPTLLNVKTAYYSTLQILQQTPSGLRMRERTFINDFKAFIEEKRQTQIKNETIKTYNTTLNKLTEFQREKKFVLDYTTINTEFYNRFLMFLYEQKLLDNTIDKHIKNIKLFMTYSLAKKKHLTLEYKTFKRTRHKADFVILEIPELRKLYQHDFSSNPHLEKIRDFFLLGCSTGLRFSDLNKLNTGNFFINIDPFTHQISQHITEGYIETYIRKTSDKLKLPFNNFIVEFVYKYIYQKPYFNGLRMSNQKFNDYVKDVCKEAKIDGMKEIIKTMGKENKVFQEPKYKFVSSHTMRRSFISLLAHGANTSNIQLVSGHKDLKVLSDYIKKTDRDYENVRKSINADVFNTSKYHD